MIVLVETLLNLKFNATGNVCIVHSIHQNKFTLTIQEFNSHHQVPLSFLTISLALPQGFQLMTSCHQIPSPYQIIQYIDILK
jgi:hypothetical protein